MAESSLHPRCPPLKPEPSWQGWLCACGAQGKMIMGDPPHSKIKYFTRIQTATTGHWAERAWLVRPHRLYAREAHPASWGWWWEVEGDTEFTRLMNPITVPTFIVPSSSPSLQMTSPERPPRIILPSFEKGKTGKFPARRLGNSTLRGGLRLGESVFWRVCVHRRPREQQTLYPRKPACLAFGSLSGPRASRAEEPQLPQSEQSWLKPGAWGCWISLSEHTQFRVAWFLLMQRNECRKSPVSGPFLTPGPEGSGVWLPGVQKTHLWEILK